mmetsp:Transcript_2585/g.9258  ORF Transcript_2585/g.9258 Transcript_2585/m.9258 type:complete len:354 (+) Transcript_2585:186-1247(+)
MGGARSRDVLVLHFCLCWRIINGELPICDTNQHRGKEISLAYACFWKRFSTNHRAVGYLSSALESRGFELCLSNAPDADILFFSVFGSLRELHIYRRCKVKIFYSGENLQLLRFQKFSAYLRSQIEDEIVPWTLEQDFSNSSLAVPPWFFAMDLANPFSTASQAIAWNDQPMLQGRKHAVTIINSHAKMVGGLDGRARLEGYENLEKQGIIVDSPGKFQNNMVSLEVQNVTKMKFLERYVFNLCPENSFGKCYVSEKLFQAVLTGVIPIYWGDASCVGGIINLDRIITFSPGSSAKEMAAHVRQLLDDTEALSSFWNQPVFAKQAPATLSHIISNFNAVVGRIISVKRSRSLQ